MCEFKYLSLNISLENLLEPVNISMHGLCRDAALSADQCDQMRVFDENDRVNQRKRQKCTMHSCQPEYMGDV